MDKTYAETKNENPIDWNEVLDRAIKKELRIYSEEFNQLRHKANYFVTCAVGNMCAIIPRIEDKTNNCRNGAPEDKLLDLLGIEFARQFGYGYFRDAKKTLREIEIRADELIKIELTKLNENRPGKNTGLEMEKREEGSGK